MYIVVPKGGMKGSNDVLLQYITSKASITGMVVEKGETKLLIYTKVEPVKE